jgi:hypothetical protein
MPLVTGTTTEFSISYRKWPDNSQVQVDGAWFGINAANGSIWGDALSTGFLLEPNENFVWIDNNPRVRFKSVPWWTVREGTWSWDDYNRMANIFQELISAYANNPPKIQALNEAIATVNYLIKGARKLLELVSIEPTVVTEAEPTFEQLNARLSIIGLA